MRLKVEKARMSDVYLDIARIPENHRKDASGKTIIEGAICKLSVDSGKHAFILVRGSQDAQGNQIRLDERGRNILGVSINTEYDFEVSEVGLLGQFLWAWKASDPAYRVAARLALLSVVLGAAGILLGLASLLAAVCL